MGLSSTFFSSFHTGFSYCWHQTRDESSSPLLWPHPGMTKLSLVTGGLLACLPHVTLAGDVRQATV